MSSSAGGRISWKFDLFLNNPQVLVHLLQETSWCLSNPLGQVKCIIIERKLIQLSFEYEAVTICFVNVKISPQLTVGKESQLAYGDSMCFLTTSVYSFKEDPQQG